ncbi:hypothetical protein NIES4072_64010 [Nostoc commune NIES-4072]|uniref:Uncharacterized protein n=1 Tax=Nostoc commune NIES-4072 TaxID=2005467 RepID=A0A2R5FX95_NOSCO|nr:hypothetical protein [Nostoc commune]BBD66330.1 hypothetical protein NIES4070_26950 [Nostoc commune HK-02]GBG22689.1 hypothetical protein NIES4072_64010 [Nostoc commune NIES-4072]
MWSSLGIFSVEEHWKLTTTTKAELIRITHLSVPIRQDYVKAVIAQGFQEDAIISISTPQRLTCRQEKEIFSFPNLDNLEKRIVFRRLDKANEIILKIKVEEKNMLISSNKTQITTAQALPDISLTNTKKTIVLEKTDASRRNYLISNLGAATAYFKYVPLGVDPTVTTLIVSSTDYDFALASGDKWLDSTLSQNGVIGITANALSTAKIKAVEYVYL